MRKGSKGTCSTSAQATLFFQMSRLETALSHVCLRILSTQPLNPYPESARVFHLSSDKPLPSLVWIVTVSYNLLLPPFATTVYSRPGNHSDPAYGQQTLSLLSYALHSPRAAHVCAGLSSSLATACSLCSTRWPLCSLSDTLLPQGLCTCCALCPEHFSQKSNGSLTSFSHPSVEPSQTAYLLVPFSGISYFPSLLY